MEEFLLLFNQLLLLLLSKKKCNIIIFHIKKSLIMKINLNFKANFFFRLLTKIS